MQNTMINISSVNRKELAGYYINQAIQYMVLEANQMRLEKIIGFLRAAAVATGPNTMMYSEIVNVINDLKDQSTRLRLNAYQAWFMVSQITTKMRSSNQMLKEFMLNLKTIDVLQYLIVPEERELNTEKLIQAEQLLNFDKILEVKEQTFKNNQEFKDSQKSYFNFLSQEKTIHVFEINLNGKIILFLI